MQDQVKTLKTQRPTSQTNVLEPLRANSATNNSSLHLMPGHKLNNFMQPSSMANFGKSLQQPQLLHQQISANSLQG